MLNCYDYTIKSPVNETSLYNSKNKKRSSKKNSNIDSGIILSHNLLNNVLLNIEIVQKNDG